MKFRVVHATTLQEFFLDARTPEAAAQSVVGHPVSRSTGGSGALAAKVYWEAPNEVSTMARFYALKNSHVI